MALILGDPFEYYLGCYNDSFESRNDNMKMNCQHGQCGGRCLKRGEKCRLRDRLSGMAQRASNKKNPVRQLGKNIKKGAKGAVQGTINAIEEDHRKWEALGADGRVKQRTKAGAITGAIVGGFDGKARSGNAGGIIGGALMGGLEEAAKRQKEATYEEGIRAVREAQMRRRR